jgi:hypothetical protein
MAATRANNQPAVQAIVRAEEVAELLIGLVVVAAELPTGLAAEVAELPIDPVVAELLTGLVEEVAELLTGLVVAVAEQPLGLVAAGTASVIRTSLVPAVAAAALAVVAAAVAAQREPAPIEVATAWEAAGTAAAAEGAVDTEAAVEAAVAAVEEDGDKRFDDGGTPMKSKSNIMTSSKALASMILIFGCLAASLSAAPPAKQDTGAATTAGKPKQFNTPKEAADSLVQAAESFDVPALKEILGPDSDDIISSEDPVADKNRAVAFATKAKEANALGLDSKNPNRAILTVGKDNFQLPIPIVKNKGKWSFDTKIGREEILNRRIGTNELDAIAICRGFVEAQEEYSQTKHDDSKVNQYAQKIISTPGKQDGLAWKNADGTWGGPVGEGVARALEQGYSDKTKPFHGYFFKVLKGQGPAASMGQMDFMVGDAMIGGFALAAAPAEYRVTGVKTFIVGPNGVVYEKDLGKDTLKTFETMDKYNPDKTWKPTGDQWPEEEEEAPKE